MRRKHGKGGRNKGFQIRNLTSDSKPNPQNSANEDLSFKICRMDVIVFISLGYLKRKVSNLYGRHLEAGSESKVAKALNKLF